MTPRSEPLLWLQLIGLAAMPLELLLVLLLLAGSDPGPWPDLERVVVWSLGAVAPAVLLWRQPPDPLSLLLLCTPQRQRRPEQRALTSEPVSLPLKLLLASGAVLLLPGLWWLDTSSVLAHSFALLPDSNRLVPLLAVVPVLALLVWQWQQLVQATSLLLGGAGAIGEPQASSSDQPQPQQRLCLGLPWLRLPGLEPDPDKPAQPGLPSPASTLADPLEVSEPLEAVTLAQAAEAGPTEAADTQESEAGQELETTAEAAPEKDRDPETERKAEEEQEPEAPFEPEREPEPNQEIEAVLEPEPTEEPEPQPEPDAKPDAALQPAPEAQTEPEPEQPGPKWSEPDQQLPSEQPEGDAAQEPAPELKGERKAPLEPEITDVAFTPIEEPELELPASGEPDESAPVAIEPEQAAEHDQGTNLDEPIA